MAADESLNESPHDYQCPGCGHAVRVRGDSPDGVWCHYCGEEEMNPT